MESYQELFIVFAVAWVVTFVPAWWLLLRLLAMSATPKRRSVRFWSLLILYRLIISAPYIALLVVGASLLSDVIKSFILGLLVATFVFSFIRFRFSHKIVHWLWWLYGYFYDGLLNLAPYRNLIKQVLARCREAQPAPHTVLEIGCGTGNVLQALSKVYPNAKVTGVDNSTSMIRIAQRKVAGIENATVLREDALWYLTNARDKSFDLIVMQNVVYAISDREKLWRESLRVLRDSGAVVVTNSDKAGNSTIIREHLATASVFELLHPKLIIVGIIDAFISHLSRTGSFAFVPLETLRDEIRAAGGSLSEHIERCYGGVNILFDIKKIERSVKKP